MSMAELIRAHDWARTPLGAPDCWPDRLTAAVELMLAAPQIATLAVGPERVHLYNDEAARHYGGRHPAVLGLPLADAFPHEFALVAPFYDRVFVGESVHVPAQELDPAESGAPETFDAHLTPVRAVDGRVIATFMTGTATGVRMRLEARLRRSEERQRFVLRLADALRPLADPQEVQATAARLLGEQLGLDRVAYGEFEPDDVHMTVARDWRREGAPSTTGRFRPGLFGRFTDALLAGRTAAMADARADPDVSPAEYEGGWAAVGVRAAVAAPIVKAGQVVASLFVHSFAPRRWTDEDVALIEAVAERTWAEVVRARAEERLRESEARFRGFVTASTDVVYRMSPDWTEMREMSGRDFLADTLSPAGDWMDRYIAPEDQDWVRAEIDRAIAGKAMFTLEHRVRRADGGVGWTSSRAVPILDGEGAIAEWIGAATDVTARREAAEALREGEARLAAAFESAPVGVAVIDRGGRIVLSNAEYRRFLPAGVMPSADPDGGRRWRAWDAARRPIGPADFPGARALRGERVIPGQEMLYTDDGGREIWTRVTAVPIHGAAGQVTGLASVISDIDALKRAQEQQGVLIAELQHRVRNILAVVRSVFGRTLEAGGDLEEVADHFTGRLDSLARTQVVVTSRPDQGVDLENLIRDELLSAAVGDGPALSISGPDVQLPAKAAETLGLVLHELTTNALKYGALNHPGGRIAISWTLDAGYSGERVLNLYWTEQGVPAVPLNPARRGFGSELITEALPYRLGAETRLEFRGGGVRCAISLPLPRSGRAAALEG